MFPEDTERGEIKWYNPKNRSIIPLDQFRVSVRMQKLVQKSEFTITFNADFEGVLRACGERRNSWISPRIAEVYRELYRMGVVNSMEAWQDGQLVGGGFGTAIGGLYSGETMFYRVRNASKVALVHLYERLKAGGFVLIDCQYPSDHFEQFGSIQVSREEYRRWLARALIAPATFNPGTNQAQQTPGQDMHGGNDFPQNDPGILPSAHSSIVSKQGIYPQKLPDSKKKPGERLTSAFQSTCASLTNGAEGSSAVKDYFVSSFDLRSRCPPLCQGAA
jgi:leucyl/phenylalanyl-tRNA--protein transferase